MFMGAYYIKLKEDVTMDGELSFTEDVDYEVYSNGNSRDMNREFIVSNISGRVMSLLSLSGYKYIRVWKD